MLAFWASHAANDWTSFLGGPVQTLEGVGGLSILGWGFKATRCHHEDCRKRGKFRYGHLLLCEIHHPHVPNSGRITRDRIDQVGEPK